MRMYMWVYVDVYYCRFVRSLLRFLFGFADVRLRLLIADA